MAALLMAASLGSLRVKRGRWWDRAAVGLAGALLASLAWTGHASVEPGLGGALHRLNDAAHLLTAGVWLGALPPFLRLLARAADSGEAGEVEARLVRFHGIGLAAVPVLGATGLINGLYLVGPPSNLFSTPYGLVLLAKLALFAVMVGSRRAIGCGLCPTCPPGLAMLWPPARPRTGCELRSLRNGCWGWACSRRWDCSECSRPRNDGHAQAA